MQEWTIKSLDDDNIPKDSDFYEYIGRMMELEEFLRENKKNSGNFVPFNIK